MEGGPSLKQLWWQWQQGSGPKVRLKYFKSSASRVRKATVAGCRLGPTCPVLQGDGYGAENAPLASLVGALQGTPRVSWGTTKEPPGSPGAPANV
ncbi:hypothetical protein NDU88_004388 [Pleurodeles waltl]|uniref:Uncharacterized protein n=1 Tax=Pleurodeles waltl TaxID=8319 RepID=A0AAV7KXJ7_PLEWA|nr:hypothetical protein NDU88_004388 [Pleurodeles waltl]